MTLNSVFNRLFDTYGAQNWWPGDTRFEVMVGAILTQNTAWTNVEKAIFNLKSNHSLDPKIIATISTKKLAQWLKPSGYFNIKANRLQNYCKWFIHQGGYHSLNKLETNRLRKRLLSVNGVGPETADDILLYAFERPVFVIDAYTRRLFSRLGLIEPDLSYENLRQFFETHLETDASLFNEYHALIVIHAKNVCNKKPKCMHCCLTYNCPAKNDYKMGLEVQKTEPNA